MFESLSSARRAGPWLKSVRGRLAKSKECGRKLSQLEIATELSLTERTVRRIETGEGSSLASIRAYGQLLLAYSIEYGENDLAHELEEYLENLDHAERTTSPGLMSYRLLNREQSYGRAQELKRIDSAVRKGNRIVVLTGTIGIGKKTVVLKYAREHEHRYDLVWSVDCRSRLAANFDLQSMLEATGFHPAPAIQSIGDFGRLIRGRQRNRLRKLLILLDVTTADLVYEVATALPDATVLATSVTDLWPVEYHRIRIDGLEPADSMSLLGPYNDGGGNASLICDLYGGNPAAIKAFASYLVCTGKHLNDAYRLVCERPSLPLRFGAIAWGQEKALFELYELILQATRPDQARSVFEMLSVLRSRTIDIEDFSQASGWKDDGDLQLSLVSLARTGLIRLSGNEIEVDEVAAVVARALLSDTDKRVLEESARTFFESSKRQSASCVLLIAADLFQRDVGYPPEGSSAGESEVSSVATAGSTSATLGLANSQWAFLGTLVLLAGALVFPMDDLTAPIVVSDSAVRHRDSAVPPEQDAATVGWRAVQRGYGINRYLRRQARSAPTASGWTPPKNRRV